MYLPTPQELSPLAALVVTVIRGEGVSGETEKLGWIPGPATRPPQSERSLEAETPQISKAVSLLCLKL